MCRNGQYTERGIKQIDGFMAERWRIEPEYAMKVAPALGLLGVLLEPTTVVAKAWEAIAAVGRRAFWEPQTVLVTGAGPIGLLAALIGVQHGLHVHVLDRVEAGLKPELVHALGAQYHTGTVAEVGFEPDVIVECTGVGPVITDAIQAVGAGGIVCLTGVGAGGPPLGGLASGQGEQRSAWGGWHGDRRDCRGGPRTGKDREAPRGVAYERLLLCTGPSGRDS
jgi:threonine dehydrogenase-like Zn-dependent dehydrogenase